jgi:phosphoribosyl 1,2-cyclic phosphate phosphodiesterase
LAKQPRSIDITGQMILLGTGTSVGVPALGCNCPVCVGQLPRNIRTRCSAILGFAQGNLLIDTSPDLRTQFLREGLGVAHAVLYTHEHSDHVMGFDDLRLFQFYLGTPVPIYCQAHVAKCLRRVFDYAFSDEEQTHAGAVPAVDIREIGTEPFHALGQKVIPIPMEHGPKFSVLGFRIGNVAYCTDVSAIPDSSRKLLEGLDTLVLDALRPAAHPTHLNVEQAIEIAQELKPGKTYFTHCACHLDYYEVNSQLPPGIELGYDGLRIPLT